MKLTLFSALFICLHMQANNIVQHHKAVTYELSPGRFGDNLLSYIHAKWIAYRYNIPVLFKPFIYSDKLLLQKNEIPYDGFSNNFSKKIVIKKNVTVSLESPESILYIVPYFPESSWEKKNNISFSGGSWEYFDVDWSDKNFISELQLSIVPNIPIPEIKVPENTLTIGVHIRRGGNHDTPETIPQFPLKFLPDSFYVNQIRRIYALTNTPLYVYLFTDDNNPKSILDRYKAELANLPIQLDCRKEGNCDTSNVIEDFFSMKQFDCLIHSESNFSFIISKIHTYLIAIYPDSFKKEPNGIMYDNINVIIDENHPKSFLLQRN